MFVLSQQSIRESVSSNLIVQGMFRCGSFMARDGLGLHAPENGSKGTSCLVGITLTAWHRGKGSRV